MRCSNVKCCKSKNEIYRRKKIRVQNFENFSLSSGEIIYIIFYSFLSRHSTQQIRYETGLAY